MGPSKSPHCMSPQPRTRPSFPPVVFQLSRPLPPTNLAPVPHIVFHGSWVSYAWCVDGNAQFRLRIMPFPTVPGRLSNEIVSWTTISIGRRHCYKNRPVSGRQRTKNDFEKDEISSTENNGTESLSENLMTCTAGWYRKWNLIGEEVFRFCRHFFHGVGLQWAFAIAEVCVDNTCPIIGTILRLLFSGIEKCFDFLTNLLDLSTLLNKGLTHWDISFQYSVSLELFDHCLIQNNVTWHTKHL